jgi:hypothetical protein
MNVPQHCDLLWTIGISELSSNESNVTFFLSLFCHFMDAINQIVLNGQWFVPMRKEILFLDSHAGEDRNRLVAAKIM